MRLLTLRFILNGALLLLATLFRGVWLDSLPAMLLPTIVLMLANATLPLLMVLLSVPLTRISLGVAAVFANLALVVALDRLIPSFHAQGILDVASTATLFAGLNYGLNWLEYRGPLRQTP